MKSRENMVDYMVPHISEREARASPERRASLLSRRPSTAGAAPTGRTGPANGSPAASPTPTPAAARPRPASTATASRRGTTDTLLSMKPLAPSTHDGFFDDFGGFAPPEGSSLDQEGLDDGFIYADVAPGGDGQAARDWRQHPSQGQQQRPPSVSVSESYRRREAEWSARRGPYGATSLRRALNSGYTADGSVRLPSAARAASAGSGSGRGGARRLAGTASGLGIHKELFHRLPEVPALPTRLTHEAILAEPTPTRVAEGLCDEPGTGFDEEYDGARTRNAEELAHLQVPPAPRPPLPPAPCFPLPPASCLLPPASCLLPPAPRQEQICPITFPPSQLPRCLSAPLPLFPFARALLPPTPPLPLLHRRGTPT